MMSASSAALVAAKKDEDENLYHSHSTVKRLWTCNVCARQVCSSCLSDSTLGTTLGALRATRAKGQRHIKSKKEKPLQKDERITHKKRNKTRNSKKSECRQERMAAKRKKQGGKYKRFKANLIAPDDPSMTWMRRKRGRQYIDSLKEYYDWNGNAALYTVFRSSVFLSCR